MDDHQMDAEVGAGKSDLGSLNPPISLVRKTEKRRDNQQHVHGRRSRCKACRQENVPVHTWLASFLDPHQQLAMCSAVVLLSSNTISITVGEDMSNRRGHRS